ncbi:MAG: cation-translocating P-type ATPase [Archangiaceae bacterium]|nr:cation-translocating P-type ATPase [Archangiaceae bacterium]
MSDGVEAPAGLSSAEAKERLAREGPNELTAARKRTFFATLFHIVREPMVLLLLACSALYFSFGDLREAVLLAASIGLVIGITLVQERKTERALEALKSLSSPRASVIRDGKASRISAGEVVRGDVLLLEEGDRVPADAVVLSASGLRVDESLLTGESVAVTKQAAPSALPMQSPGVEQSPFVYASTLVVGGRATGQVQATGSSTEVGKIGRALETLSAGQSPLNRQITVLVRTLGSAAAVVCVAVFLIYGFGQHAWRQGLLAGLTLAMSLLPEEFPVVMTLFLVLGAYRMSKRQVLARRLAALETLGSATVLCTDKTGTLTENKLRVVKLIAGPDGEARASGALSSAAERRLAATAALACPPQSFDAVDQAAVAFGLESLGDPGWPARGEVLHEYPLSPGAPVLTEARAVGDQILLAMKGSPEAVAARCGRSAAELAKIHARVEAMAAEGLKMIAVARAFVPQLPERLEEVTFELLGLLGLEDPLRAGVAEAVSECRAAGIRVLMITGDHPRTALAIARQAGLDAEDCLSGAELDGLPDEALAERLKTVSVFARVSPLNKLRLVKSLRAAGDVVAMTGDGVNDAPALRAAHIGVAMGGRGTDVAREAADLVVLDDDFVSIVGAVRSGRRIYDNLQKSLGYVLAVHVPIAGMGLIPLLFGWPLLFTPVHIVFLELIIDPTCSIAFEMEPEESNVMKRPPRAKDARLLGLKQIGWSVAEGAVVLAAMVVTFWVGLHRHAGPADARAISFATLILGNVSLILMNRSRSRGLWQTLRARNPAWWAILVGALIVLALTLYVPPLRDLFQFSLLHSSDLALCLGAWAGLFTVLAVLRGLSRDRGRREVRPGRRQPDLRIQT